MSSASVEPDYQTLERVSQLEVYNSMGDKVKFGTIFEDRKIVIVFLRESLKRPHFRLNLTHPLYILRSFLLRGMCCPTTMQTCYLAHGFSSFLIFPLDLQGGVETGDALLMLMFRQQYVMQIASTVRVDALREANSGVVLVGCGEWELIKEYKGIAESHSEASSCL